MADGTIMTASTSITRQGRWCVLIVCINDGVVALAAAQARTLAIVVCLSHRQLGEKDLIIVAVSLLFWK